MLNHFLVPPMHVMKEEQAALLLKKLQVEKNQLPAIRSNDPVIHTLNAAIGDIVAIERKDETGKYLAYRVVVGV
ncbi:MAG TPA: DNA-directed RNA polymerase subunit RpoH/Rpb5 C-terminal domain-containing protein [Candidatus Bilamarchaeaceae archaeon]|nr:DNA-directed RNA polymerase subunit RpoH/Rpb5 C-terminal domain-containing protein [Candidatus Bilamarchaeaceae archaeon]